MVSIVKALMGKKYCPWCEVKPYTWLERNVLDSVWFTAILKIRPIFTALSWCWKFQGVIGIKIHQMHDPEWREEDE